MPLIKKYYTQRNVQEKKNTGSCFLLVIVKHSNNFNNHAKSIKSKLNPVTFLGNVYGSL